MGGITSPSDMIAVGQKREAERREEGRNRGRGRREREREREKEDQGRNPGIEKKKKLGGEEKKWRIDGGMISSPESPVVGQQ